MVFAGDLQTYNLCIQLYTVYIHFCNVRLAFIVFWYSSFRQNCGSLAVQRNTPRLRLLALHVIQTLSTFFRSISIIKNCMYVAMSKSDITAYVKICSPLQSRLITSNFSSVPVVFWDFFTWSVVGYLDLCFSLRASSVKEESK